MKNKAKRILIGEDEKPIARALELKLRSAGFQTTIVSNGDDLLKALQTGNFNLVLLDLVMPKMDGFHVLETLEKQKIRTPPIIILSNLGQEEDIQRTKDMGACAYFIKSNTPISKIVEYIKNKLNK